ncbi:hypothetical protein QOZ80_7BG0592000 [Eleusine coracana subsp. coracana]|nr:hypothetical protein QOZ80_7BG0592000 [Eleusine coracana subsp. coracana]
MSDRGQGNAIWEHGEKRGSGWLCKYCKTGKAGGGAIRFKEHLACRGGQVVHCSFVPPDVHDYFRADIDRTAQKKKDRIRDRLYREEIAVEGNVREEDDKVIQRVLQISQEEDEFARRVHDAGGHYEHGGGSGSSQPQGSGGGGLMGMLRRITSRRGSQREATVQTRIDTGPWTYKAKTAKQAIGRAWAKFMHAEAIAGAKADSPYFIAAIKETQRWGQGVPSPTGRDVDGIYLDENEAEIKKHFARFKMDWPAHGVTIMCDSWTGPTGMSVINFMIYCNGVMFFHKSVDATGQSQDANYLYKEIEKVIKEVGPEHVMQIITDNGANYKKACKLIRRKQEYESLFHNDKAEFDCYMNVIEPRMGDIANDTYVNAAVGLNPRTHYAYTAGQSILQELCTVFEFMTDTETCMSALQEAENYRRNTGPFTSDLARKMVYDSKTSPAQWWAMFGTETPTLQKLALRLVSQCCSSSGCERNWSTFALIHTKVRNRLSYQKLHKLVYVNYNLRIRMREAGLYRVPEEDPFHKLIELSLYHERNPIREWMENGRSNADPVLDEEATDSDVPIPSKLVTQDDDPRELWRILGTSSLVSWAERNVDDTHTGKRKHNAVARKAPTNKKKKNVEKEVRRNSHTLPRIRIMVLHHHNGS